MFQLTNQPTGEPIIVLANMHSGTTLLQQILGRNPTIFVSGGETGHFSSLPITQKRFVDLNDDNTLREYLIYMVRVIYTGYATVNFIAPHLDSMSELSKFGITKKDIETLFQISEDSRDYNQIYVLVFNYLTGKAGKNRWLDKLPGYVSQFGQIRNAVPEAKFIELVRDPRDILVSKKKRVSRGGGYDPLWDSLAWKAAVKAGRIAYAQFPDQVLRVKYENLVSTPTEEVPRICEFLNLEFEDLMLGVGWINTTTGSAAGENQGISTAAIGKWVNQLPATDLAICQMVAKGEMGYAGYKVSKVSQIVYLKMPFLFIKSGFEFFSRLIDRWRQGGFKYFLNVLANYRLRLQR